MDPYLFGMWLGDGMSDGTGFALNYKTDFETLAYWENWAEENGAVIKKGDSIDFLLLLKRKQCNKNHDYYAKTIWSDGSNS